MDIVKDPAIVNAAALTATERDLRRKRTLRAAAALIGALALAFGSYWGWRTWASSSDAATRLVTATVQRGSVEDAVTATGTLQPRDYVDVGT